MTLSKRYIKWVNIILGMIFIGPLIVAWMFFYHGGVSFLGQVNNGQLITPLIPSSDLPIKRYDESDMHFKRKWTLLYRKAHCDKQCEKVMDTILRVRLALGKDMGRTQASLLSNDKVSAELTSLMTNVRRLDITPLLFISPSRATREVFANTVLDEANDIFGDKKGQLVDNSIYLVDPLGNILMRYNDSTLPRSIYSDLTRLLKVSKIG